MTSGPLKQARKKNNSLQPLNLRLKKPQTWESFIYIQRQALINMKQKTCTVNASRREKLIKRRGRNMNKKKKQKSKVPQVFCWKNNKYYEREGMRQGRKWRERNKNKLCPSKCTRVSALVLIASDRNILSAGRILRYVGVRVCTWLIGSYYYYGLWIILNSLSRYQKYSKLSHEIRDW